MNIFTNFFFTNTALRVHVFLQCSVMHDLNQVGEKVLIKVLPLLLQ